MAIVSLLLNMTGGLCMFLLGMKIMSDGIQKSAGDRLRKTLNFMTGNRFAGVLTGFAVTAVIQSSSATTVMVVSFVNAGLLTLTQSIGVIMGANIGTTVTGWIVSLLGFSINISNLALPAVGIGFVFSVIKWKYKSLGEFIMGFGLLFMGLHYLTHEMSTINSIINFDALSAYTEMGALSVLMGAGAGLVMTLFIHSSSASVAIVLTMAYNGIISYLMAASMVLGASIGTTIDAVLASIGGRADAKRSALFHVLFNVIGTMWALPLLIPLLKLVDFLTPGEPILEIAKTWKLGAPLGFGVTAHLAMLHSIFKILNTLLFLPFVNYFPRIASLIIKEDKSRGKPKDSGIHYVLSSFSGTRPGTPELNMIRVEKEIRDMAGIVSSMYARFSALLRDLRETEDRESAVASFCEEMKQKEEYADEMRETLTGFLMDCTREQLNPRTEQKVARLLRVIGDIEEMSDECYGISLLLGKSVRKKRIFKNEEMDELVPYVNQVEGFLGLLHDRLGQNPTAELTASAKKLEADVGKSRKQLQKLSRKRIEAGKNLQTELLFIDLVRRIEKLGDYCVGITEKISS
ncbi:MAG: Na/Pi cotransporter family protein [Treponema sp.]|nr:Na/Pi cotransporter family protein [Treponema sp.]MCL2126647.1 Na/Pi cotransporter family protein [Treponema sp.]